MALLYFSFSRKGFSNRLFTFIFLLSAYMKTPSSTRGMVIFNSFQFFQTKISRLEVNENSGCLVGGEENDIFCCFFFG